MNEDKLIPSFEDSLHIKPDWNTISWSYNMGEYPSKQDKAALFWNSFIYLEDKLDRYFEKYNRVNYNVLHEEVFRFRQHFPIQGREEGINYYDDLVEQLIQKYERLQASSSLVINKITPRDSKRLTVPQIALILVYKGVSVSKENAGELIREYGYTSGDHLYNEFRAVIGTKERTKNPGTKITLKNKIDLLESVLDHLTINEREKAEKEINTLKNYQID